MFEDLLENQDIISFLVNKIEELEKKVNYLFEREDQPQDNVISIFQIKKTYDLSLEQLKLWSPVTDFFKSELNKKRALLCVLYLVEQNLTNGSRTKNADFVAILNDYGLLDGIVAKNQRQSVSNLLRKLSKFGVLIRPDGKYHYSVAPEIRSFYEQIHI